MYNDYTLKRLKGIFSSNSRKREIEDGSSWYLNLTLTTKCSAVDGRILFRVRVSSLSNTENKSPLNLFSNIQNTCSLIGVTLRRKNARRGFSRGTLRRLRDSMFSYGYAQVPRVKKSPANTLWRHLFIYLLREQGWGVCSCGWVGLMMRGVSSPRLGKSQSVFMPAAAQDFWLVLISILYISRPVVLPSHKWGV